MSVGRGGRERESDREKEREEINDINISCSCHLGAKAFMYIHEGEASWPQRLKATSFAWFWAPDETHTHTDKHRDSHINKYSWAPGATACTLILPLLYSKGGKESSTESNSQPLQAWKAVVKIGNFILHRTATVVSLKPCQLQRIPIVTHIHREERKNQKVPSNFSNHSSSIINLVQYAKQVSKSHVFHQSHSCC